MMKLLDEDYIGRSICPGMVCLFCDGDDIDDDHPILIIVNGAPRCYFAPAASDVPQR